MGIEKGFQKSKEKFSLGLKEIWKGLENKKEDSKKQIAKSMFLQSMTIAKKTPIIYAMTIVTIATCFFIFALYLLLTRNLNETLENSHKDLQISVYFKDNASNRDIKQLSSHVMQIDDVEKIEFLSKKDAMNYFKKIMPQNSSVLEGLEDEENPFPASIEVFLKKNASKKNTVSIIKKMTKDKDFVDEIIYNSGYAKKILETIHEFRTISRIGFLLILLIAGFIIFNTIKLSMLNQQREIQIMKLIGANLFQLRMPYIINGGLQGLLGGFCSIILLYIFSLSLKAMLVKSLLLSWIENSILFLGFWDWILILFVGFLLGILSSFITVRRFDEE